MQPWTPFSEDPRLIAADAELIAHRVTLSTQYPPENYTTPPFPSLYWPPQSTPQDRSLYRLSDIWRFTLLWTLLIYAIFHLGAAGIAIVMQLARDRSKWKYLFTIPVAYSILAGVEALFAGSVVGLMCVPVCPRLPDGRKRVLTGLQCRRRLHVRLLLYVYLDTLHMGLG